MINSNRTCTYWETCSNEDQRACAPRPEHTRLISSRSTLQNQMDGKKHGIPHHIYPNPRQTVAIKIVRMRKQRQQAAILPKIYGGWSKQDSEAKDHILIPVWLLKSTKDVSKNSSSPIKMNPRDIQRIRNWWLLQSMTHMSEPGQTTRTQILVLTSMWMREWDLWENEHV